MIFLISILRLGDINAAGEGSLPINITTGDT